jgi:ABC-type lipoprotein release transport system permease subunit
MPAHGLTTFLFKKLFLNWKEHPTFSVIACFAILGFVLGICSLIVVMSIMHGFEHQMTTQLHQFSPSATIYLESKPSAERVNNLILNKQNNQHIRTTVPLKGYFSSEVLGENMIDVVLLDKVLFEKLSPFIKEKYEKLPVLIGSEASHRLMMPKGSQSELILPTLYEDPLGLISKSIPITIDGKIKTGVYRVDEYSIFLPPHVLGLQDIPTNEPHEVHLFGKFSEKELNTISKAIGGISVKTWEEQNRLLLLALWLEQFSMSVFLCLIIIVALSSIVALLTIFFTDRKKMLGLLLCLGCSTAHIRKLMTQFGLIIGGVGTLLGTFLAIGVLFYIVKSESFLLPNIYYQRSIPIHVDWGFLACVIGGSLLTCMIVSKWIAYRLLKQPLLKHFGEDPVL